MAEIELTKGDRRPLYAATLEDANGAVDLTNATISFLVWDESGSLVTFQTSTGSQVTIQSATAGTVQYAWASTDTSTAFRGFAQWRSVFADGTRASFPNDESLLTFICHAGLSTS